MGKHLLCNTEEKLEGTKLYSVVLSYFLQVLCSYIYIYIYIYLKENQKKEKKRRQNPPYLHVYTYFTPVVSSMNKIEPFGWNVR